MIDSPPLKINLWRIWRYDWGTAQSRDIYAGSLAGALGIVQRCGLALETISSVQGFDSAQKAWIAVSEGDLQWEIAQLSGGDAA
jgi:hypothetical protein